MEPQMQPPPMDPREYATKDELRTYYPTKATLEMLKTDLVDRIRKSQQWTIGTLLAALVVSTAIVAAAVLLTQD